MFLLIVILQLLPNHDCQMPLDDDVKARLEEKVMKSMSLKEIEDMVEKDERVLTAPRNQIIILPEGSRNDPNKEAYIIQRKPKSYVPSAEIAPQHRYSNQDHEDNNPSLFNDDFQSSLFKRSYLPRFRYESAFKFGEHFPSLFEKSELESRSSNPSEKFYESVFEKFIGQKPIARRTASALDTSASEDLPTYKPRFDHDSYSKDTTETKLKGKNYWRDEPQRREGEVDEKGCRTVVKKIIDPEDAKKSNGANAKSVIITKECESPSIDGPDAKIPDMEPLHLGMTRTETSFDEEPSSYESSRPVELDLPSAKTRDPLAPDYIDKMLDSHFKSFSSFNNPITSFRGYQDRFKLSIPSAFKDIKPTVNVESYEHSHPKSGFESETSTADESSRNLPKSKHSYRYEYPEQTSGKSDAVYETKPKVYEHHHHYSYPEKSPENIETKPKVYEHHHHYSHPEKVSDDVAAPDYVVKKEFPTDDKYTDKKEPKMMKKSFAYYRKDNPKEDPNDQQYAEEYAQGNYRSFSSDYDSERDGPKKD